MNYSQDLINRPVSSLLPRIFPTLPGVVNQNQPSPKKSAESTTPFCAPLSEYEQFWKRAYEAKLTDSLGVITDQIVENFRIPNLDHDEIGIIYDLLKKDVVHEGCTFTLLELFQYLLKECPDISIYIWGGCLPSILACYYKRTVNDLHKKQCQSLSYEDSEDLISTELAEDFKRIPPDFDFAVTVNYGDLARLRNLVRKFISIKKSINYEDKAFFDPTNKLEKPFLVFTLGSKEYSIDLTFLYDKNIDTSHFTAHGYRIPIKELIKCNGSIERLATLKIAPINSYRGGFQTPFDRAGKMFRIVDIEAANDRVWGGWVSTRINGYKYCQEELPNKLLDKINQDPSKFVFDKWEKHHGKEPLALIPLAITASTSLKKNKKHASGSDLYLKMLLDQHDRETEDLKKRGLPIKHEGKSPFFLSLKDALTRKECSLETCYAILQLNACLQNCTAQTNTSVKVLISNFFSADPEITISQKIETSNYAIFIPLNLSVAVSAITNLQMEQFSPYNSIFDLLVPGGYYEPKFAQPNLISQELADCIAKSFIYHSHHKIQTLGFELLTVFAIANPQLWALKTLMDNQSIVVHKDLTERQRMIANLGTVLLSYLNEKDARNIFPVDGRCQSQTELCLAMGSTADKELVLLAYNLHSNLSGSLCLDDRIQFIECLIPLQSDLALKLFTKLQENKALLESDEIRLFRQITEAVKIYGKGSSQSIQVMLLSECTEKLLKKYPIPILLPALRALDWIIQALSTADWTPNAIGQFNIRYLSLQILKDLIQEKEHDEAQVWMERILKIVNPKEFSSLQFFKGQSCGSSPFSINLAPNPMASLNVLSALKDEELNALMELIEKLPHEIPKTINFDITNSNPSILIEKAKELLNNSNHHLKRIGFEVFMACAHTHAENLSEEKPLAIESLRLSVLISYLPLVLSSASRKSSELLLKAMELYLQQTSYAKSDQASNLEKYLACYHSENPNHEPKTLGQLYKINCLGMASTNLLPLCEIGQTLMGKNSITKISTAITETEQIDIALTFIARLLPENVSLAQNCIQLFIRENHPFKEPEQIQIALSFFAKLMTHNLTMALECIQSFGKKDLFFIAVGKEQQMNAATAKENKQIFIDLIEKLIDQNYLQEAKTVLMKSCQRKVFPFSEPETSRLWLNLLEKGISHPSMGPKVTFECFKSVQTLGGCPYNHFPDRLNQLIYSLTANLLDLYDRPTHDMVYNLILDINKPLLPDQKIQLLLLLEKHFEESPANGKEAFGYGELQSHGSLFFSKENVLKLKKQYFRLYIEKESYKQSIEIFKQLEASSHLAFIHETLNIIGRQLKTHYNPDKLHNIHSLLGVLIENKEISSLKMNKETPSIFIDLATALLDQGLHLQSYRWITFILKMQETNLPLQNIPLTENLVKWVHGFLNLQQHSSCLSLMEALQRSPNFCLDDHQASLQTISELYFKLSKGFMGQFTSAQLLLDHWPQISKAISPQELQAHLSEVLNTLPDDRDNTKTLQLALPLISLQKPPNEITWIGQFHRFNRWIGLQKDVPQKNEILDLLDLGKKTFFSPLPQRINDANSDPSIDALLELQYDMIQFLIKGDRHPLRFHLGCSALANIAEDLLSEGYVEVQETWFRLIDRALEESDLLGNHSYMLLERLIKCQSVRQNIKRQAIGSKDNSAFSECHEIDKKLCLYKMENCLTHFKSATDDGFKTTLAQNMGEYLVEFFKNLHVFANGDNFWLKRGIEFANECIILRSITLNDAAIFFEDFFLLYNEIKSDKDKTYYFYELYVQKCLQIQLADSQIRDALMLQAGACLEAMIDHHKAYLDIQKTFSPNNTDLLAITYSSIINTIVSISENYLFNPATLVTDQQDKLGPQAIQSASMYKNILQSILSKLKAWGCFTKHPKTDQYFYLMLEQMPSRPELPLHYISIKECVSQLVNHHQASSAKKALRIFQMLPREMWEQCPSTLKDMFLPIINEKSLYPADVKKIADVILTFSQTNENNKSKEWVDTFTCICLHFYRLMTNHKVFQLKPVIENENDMANSPVGFITTFLKTKHFDNGSKAFAEIFEIHLRVLIEALNTTKISPLLCCELLAFIQSSLAVYDSIKNNNITLFCNKIDQNLSSLKRSDGAFLFIKIPICLYLFDKQFFSKNPEKYHQILDFLMPKFLEEHSNTIGSSIVALDQLIITIIKLISNTPKNFNQGKIKNYESILFKVVDKHLESLFSINITDLDCANTLFYFLLLQNYFETRSEKYIKLLKILTWQFKNKFMDNELKDKVGFMEHLFKLTMYIKKAPTNNESLMNEELKSCKSLFFYVLDQNKEGLLSPQAPDLFENLKVFRAIIDLQYFTTRTDLYLNLLETCVKQFSTLYSRNVKSKSEQESFIQMEILIRNMIDHAPIKNIMQQTKRIQIYDSFTIHLQTKKW